MWRFFPFFSFLYLRVNGIYVHCTVPVLFTFSSGFRPKKKKNESAALLVFFFLPRYKEPFIVGRTVKEGEQLLVGLQAALRDIATTQLEIERLAAADQIKVLSKSVALI